MNPITQDEYNRMYNIDRPGSKSRWPYYKACLDILARENFANALELGSWKLSLFHDADTMDKFNWLDNVTYCHDATQIPWPVESGKYDLFIALQVWEHLGDKQIEAFKEVMRVSRMAILSFPYMWNLPNDIHHGIGYEKIAEWTCNTTPKQVMRIGSRIIYFFKFNG